MFGQSHKQPPSRWAIQLLTTEYLIEGFGNPDYLYFDNSALEDLDAITLDTAHVLPVNSQAMSGFSCQKWYGLYNSTLVAIIPRDDESLGALQEAMSDYEYSFRVELFVGPYILRGMFMSEEEDSPECPFKYEGDSYIYMTDVEIESLLPGSKLGKLFAPAAVINGMLLHGYYLRD